MVLYGNVSTCRNFLYRNRVKEGNLNIIDIFCGNYGFRMYRNGDLAVFEKPFFYM